jgi:alkanesulfonate monooxygenase SsuD/methylene tetrahydromethanopterin reductase-like flavin-dependent oxidoreductase (luciferase family)
MNRATDEMTEHLEPRREGRMKFGFLTNVPFTSEAGGARRGLEEAIETFEYAESIGFDSGWVRQRHFDNYLASPITLLSAISQRTERIRLGTGIISIRYEDPIRLAEDASTVDILSGGRLELGLAGGIPGIEAVFGKQEREYRDETQERIRIFRDAIAGKPVEFRSPELVKDDPPEFIVRPRAPELGDRLWYGAGSIPSAEQTGRIGLDLLQSTLNVNPTSESFEETQRHNIEAYLAAYQGTRHPRVCVNRLFMPAVNARQRELYAEFDRIRRTEGPAGPRPAGAQAPGVFQKVLKAENDPLRNMQLCPIYHGDPDYVIERAKADYGTQLADEVMIWLPPNFTLAENKELLDNIAEYVAPELGWAPNQSRWTGSLNGAHPVMAEQLGREHV